MCRISIIEKLDGKGNYQAADGSWKPLSVDHEVIHVRGGSGCFGRCGIDRAWAASDSDLRARIRRSVSLKWTLYDPALNAVPLYAMNTAQNWAEFSAALGTWDFPTQNVVYSDDQGHIAYHAVGKMPLRPGGLAGKPIQDAQHEWQGYIPFDAMPQRVRPAVGISGDGQLARDYGQVAVSDSRWSG